MAANRKFEAGRFIVGAMTAPTTPASGDPCVLGQVPGVALLDEDTDGNTTIDTAGVYAISVKGIDGSGNKAVAIGDILYYTSGDTPPVSVKATGVRFGYALGAVTSGSTATINAKVGY